MAYGNIERHDIGCYYVGREKVSASANKTTKTLLMRGQDLPKGKVSQTCTWTEGIHGDDRSLVLRTEAEEIDRRGSVYFIARPSWQ
jgi:hypothetical protein